MRYHEFFHMVEGRVVEMQALWDIPEMMMQAGVWPMGPSLGRYWHAPAPRHPRRGSPRLERCRGIAGQRGLGYWNADRHGPSSRRA